jgi:hypothetical protein
VSATIRIGPLEATITDYRWTSADPSLEAALNAMLNPAGPSGADPNPDLTAAQDAVGRLGGVVVAAEAPAEEPEGRIL